MYAVSEAYLEEQRQDLRNKSYVWVYLGLVNNEAQQNATVTSSVADFASVEVYGNSQFEAYYATAEQNFSLTDGSRYFMPENTSYYRVLKQGVVSKDLLGGITFTFSLRIDKISGLTIDFGEEYPTEFTVTNGNATYTYTNDTSGRFISKDVFEYSDYIKITPISMVGGQQRLRIHSIMFGVSFVFDNSNLISTKRNNEVDHLSNELPSKKFEFEIDNLSQEWTVDNPKSYSNLLKEMQIVQVTYGREVDGEIYKIPSGYMALQSWTSTHTIAKFKAVGFLDYSTTTYYKGQYSAEGTTLYEVALDIFEDMGAVSYKIDPWLRLFKTTNPVPIDFHKNCLQLVANAGQCSLYEDVNGTITIKASIAIPDKTITVTNMESISNVDSLSDDTQSYNYATGEKDYSITTGLLYFIDSESTPHPTGVVSYLYPTDKEMSITVQLMSMWTWTGITFKFGLNYPSMVTIEEYNDSVLKETNTFIVTGTNFYLDHEFYEIDKIVITFEGVADNTRIHLNKLLFGNVLDYSIANHDMSQLPTAKQTERIRNIYVKYYEFEESAITLTSAINADIGDNLATTDEPCYKYDVYYKDSETVGTIEIIEFGAYYVIFSSTVEAPVTIKATKYAKNENTVSIAINETGNDLTLANDLISSKDLANRVLNWYAEFYRADVSYDIDYRGEPALECNDRIFLENSFVNDNQILITSEEISTSQGMEMSNKVKAVRLSYTEK